MSVTDVDVQVVWSDEDEAFVATSGAFPSLSWLDAVSPDGAREGFLGLVARIGGDDTTATDEAPQTAAETARAAEMMPEAGSTDRQPGGHGERPNVLPYILGVLFLVFATVAGVQEFSGGHDGSSVKSGVHINDPMVTPSGGGH